MKQPVLRAYVLGFLVPLCAGLILAASSVHGPALGAWAHITRALDSFAVHLLALALLCLVLIFILRARWIASILFVLLLMVAVPLFQLHLAMSQPLATNKEPNLRLLWFNMLATNTTPSQSIVDRAIAEKADIVIFAESNRFKDNPDIMAEQYPYQLGCEVRCEILAFSKRPMEDSVLIPFGIAQKERLTAFKTFPENGQPVTVTAAHMSKPWYIGVTEREDYNLDRHYRKQSGPQILVGDFNAAPWSHRIRLRLERSRLKGVRIPVSTWPVSFGRFGIPIDQVFVGGGVEVVSIEQWGQDLGSNHLGLLIDLYVPPAPAQ